MGLWLGNCLDHCVFFLINIVFTWMFVYIFMLHVISSYGSVCCLVSLASPATLCFAVNRLLHLFILVNI